MTCGHVGLWKDGFQNSFFYNPELEALRLSICKCAYLSPKYRLFRHFSKEKNESSGAFQIK